MYPSSVSPSGVSQPVQLFRRATFSVAMLVLAATFSTLLHAQTHSLLYSFSGTGGPNNQQSTGQITQGGDGNLWSTTWVGGSFGRGTPSGALPFGAVTATKFTVKSDTISAITGKIAVATTGETATSSATFTVTP